MSKQTHEQTLVMFSQEELETLVGAVSLVRNQTGDEDTETRRRLTELRQKLVHASVPFEAINGPYPNAELLSLRFVEWQHIDAFLDYLDENRYSIGTYNGEFYSQTYRSRNTWRDEYLGINTREHNNELQAMLDEMRAANERKGNAN